MKLDVEIRMISRNTLLLALLYVYFWLKGSFCYVNYSGACVLRGNSVVCDSKKLQLLSDPLDIVRNWPANYTLRVCIKGYHKEDMNKATNAIVNAAEKKNFEVRGPTYLPTRRKLFTFLRSPFVHKDIRDQYQICFHKRYIDIIRKPGINNATSFTGVGLPTSVECEIYYINASKPPSPRQLANECKPFMWHSRYYSYYDEMRLQEALAKQLLANNNTAYFLLPWPRNFIALRDLSAMRLEAMLAIVERSKEIERLRLIHNISYSVPENYSSTSTVKPLNKTVKFKQKKKN